MPGVDHDDAGAFEIPDIARHHGQVVDQCRGGDERVHFIAPIWDMEMRAARRDLRGDGQDAPGEFRTDMIVEPGPQARALRGIPAPFSASSGR